MTIAKAQYPGICNNCGARCEYFVRIGAHSIRLCGSCLNELALKARTTVVKSIDDNQPYNNSIETGLVRS